MKRDGEILPSASERIYCSHLCKKIGTNCEFLHFNYLIRKSFFVTTYFMK